MDLAIVIPAYKQTFLEKTLLSLAQQTNKDFTVYVGDDCSPYELQSICNKFNNNLNIQYHRFNNNIGAKHLVHQWQRCVELMQNEKWIWLFSDDDIADNNCVEVFYKTIKTDNSRFDVYRFNTTVIDKSDSILEISPESPFIESSFDLAMGILKFKRGNSIVEHIFSKAVYEKYNGFVYTDYAQAADWATSILFSADKGICTMQGAKVNWRLSDVNLSGKASAISDMILGHFQFCTWINKHFKHLKMSDHSKYKNLQKNIEFNLLYVIRLHYRGLQFSRFKNVYAYYKTINILTAFFMTCRLYRKIKFPGFYSQKINYLKIRLGAIKHLLLQQQHDHS